VVLAVVEAVVVVVLERELLGKETLVARVLTVGAIGLVEPVVVLAQLVQQQMDQPLLLESVGLELQFLGSQLLRNQRLASVKSSVLLFTLQVVAVVELPPAAQVERVAPVVVAEVQLFTPLKQ
jgi:hypothetical protein